MLIPSPFSIEPSTNLSVWGSDFPIASTSCIEAHQTVSPLFEELARRANFVRELGQTLGNKSPLTKVFNRLQTFQMDPKELGWKEKGFFTRFFQQESWTEWCSGRNSLGKVIDCFLQQRAFSHIPPEILIQANLEAELALQASPVNHLEDRFSCSKSLSAGLLASVATKNPIPVFVSAAYCIPSTAASTGSSGAKVIKDILEKSNFGEVKQIDDALKSTVENLTQEDLTDSLIDIIVDAIDTATGLLTNPALWALEELNAKIIAVGSSRASETIEAIKKLKERKFAYGLRQMEIGQIHSEISHQTTLKQKDEEWVEKFNDYIDKNEELIENTEEFLDKTVGRYSSAMQSLLKEIHTLEQNRRGLSESIEHLEEVIQAIDTILSDTPKYFTGLLQSKVDYEQSLKTNIFAAVATSLYGTPDFDDLELQEKVRLTNSLNKKNRATLAAAKQLLGNADVAISSKKAELSDILKSMGEVSDGNIKTLKLVNQLRTQVNEARANRKIAQTNIKRINAKLQSLEQQKTGLKDEL